MESTFLWANESLAVKNQLRIIAQYKKSTLKLSIYFTLYIREGVSQHRALANLPVYDEQRDIA